MCKSKCQGTCILSIKDKPIDSKESLINIITVLDTLSTCSTSAHEYKNPDKNNSMNNIINLKTEAKKLLDELNNKTEILPEGVITSNLPHAFEYIFEEQSFKQRLINLKQKITLLQASTSNSDI